MATADPLIEAFNAANALPEGPERDEFLATACRDDSELEIQVRSLLRAHEDAGEFLKNASPPLPTLPAEKAGDRIGPYKLREQIGEGGFGSVWVAEQQNPVRRTGCTRHVAAKRKNFLRGFGTARRLI